MRLFKEYLNMAIKNIFLNKGRSILTMIGIVIGISSVITITTIGDGLKAQVIGSKTSKAKLYVYTGNGATINDDYITDVDIDMIKNTKGVDMVTPDLTETGLAKTNKSEYEISINAGNTIIKDAYLNDRIIKYGRFYSESDINSGNNVCVIRSIDAKKLFGNENAVGLEIPVTISGVTKNLEVVGILEYKDREKSIEEESEFDLVNLAQAYIPYTTLIGFKDDLAKTQSVLILTEDGAKTSQVLTLIKNKMLLAHNTKDSDYFLFEDENELFEVIGKILDYIKVFITLVAGISLVVGGVGVMNIMLVSVVERTKEIGIRKAIGANTKSILLQFLSEAIIITLIGGIIGIIFGNLIGLIICKIINFNYIFSLKSSLIATIISSVIGIVFGVYPALNASRMKPIDALRRE